jgi:hypothetical protein
VVAVAVCDGGHRRGKQRGRFPQAAHHNLSCDVAHVKEPQSVSLSPRRWQYDLWGGLEDCAVRAKPPMPLRDRCSSALPHDETGWLLIRPAEHDGMSPSIESTLDSYEWIADLTKTGFLADPRISGEKSPLRR